MSSWQIALLVVVYSVNLLTLVFIIFDTRNASKALGYMLLVITVPVIGPLIYFLVGINYRQRRLYNRKLRTTSRDAREAYKQLLEQSTAVIAQPPAAMAGQTDMAALLLNESQALLTQNRAELILNGENKFARLLPALEGALHHIHLEYYIFEDDEIGKALAALLMAKARAGVHVRMIYDAFGSKALSRAFLRRLRDAGVEVVPFSKIHFPFAASRLNYRNHRKVVIVDGRLGWTGGINVSDRYINGSNPVYWRDTHLELEGPAVYSLQRHFLADWNFCAGQHILPDERLFPALAPDLRYGDWVQIMASGPDYANPTIMLSIFTAIVNARSRVFITTPYFIPNNSINDALKKAALSGKDVRLLVPRKADSNLVTAASRSYFGELLECGVKIYEYTRGFVHAKTLLADDRLAIISTANIDFRSFEYNFEIGAVVYGPDMNGRLAAAFFSDLGDARQLSLAHWRERSRRQMLRERFARLFSPLL